MDHLIFRGGLGFSVTKIVCFPTGAKKIMSLTKLKIKRLCFIHSFIHSFLWKP